MLCHFLLPCFRLVHSFFFFIPNLTLTCKLRLPPLAKRRFLLVSGLDGIRFGLFLFLLSIAAPMQATITLSYQSFELCEDLVVEFQANLTSGGCENFPPSPDCVYDFSGYVHIRSGGTDQVTPVPFSFQYQVPFNGNGSLEYEEIIFPAANLSGLTPGNSYDLVVQLTEAYIPHQAPNGYQIFSPCFVGAVGPGGPATFTGSCFKTVDDFTYSPVSADFTWQQQTTLLCSWPGGCQVVNNLQVNFSYQIPPFVSGISYAWYINGSLFSQNQNPNYVFPNCGSYTVRLDITTDQCITSYSETIYVGNSPFCTDSEGPCCGTQRLGNPGSGPHIELDILPNPAGSSGKLTLRYALPASENVRIAIHDIRGQAVLTQTRYEDAGPQQQILVLPELPGGIYLVVLTAGDAVVSRKMMVH